MASNARMFRVLLGARLRMLGNASRTASRTHRLIIGALVLFGATIFAGIGVACAALVLVMQGDSPPGAPLTPAAMALISHVYQYLFFFLLAGSVPYVASSLFQDNDLPLLLTTPAAPSAIVAAKMLDAVVANSSQFVVLGVPVLIGLGWGMRLSPVGWGWGLLALLLVMVLTPVLTACLLLALAHLFGMRRVRFVVMLVSIGLALSITLLAVTGASRATQGGTMDYRQMRTVLMRSDTRSAEIKSAFTHSLHGAAPTTTKLSLYTAGAPWLPSTWAATVALDTAERRPIGRVGLESAGILISATILLLIFCVTLGGRVVASETILEQQDLESFGRKAGIRDRRTLPGFPLDVAGLLLKDFRYVGRDTILLGQIGTTLILFLVPFVLRATQPADGTSSNVDVYGDLTRLMISLIVFMITSIIGLSSVGLEGRGMWLVLASPMARRAFLRAKWILSFVLSLGIVAVLMVIAALVFGWTVSNTCQWLGIMACTCFALSGLGVGLGGLFPRFLYDNPAHRASIWAMILGFAFSTGYVVVCSSLFVVAWLAYGEAYPRADVVALIGVVVFVAVTLITGILPIHLAERRLIDYEWEL